MSFCAPRCRCLALLALLAAPACRHGAPPPGRTNPVELAQALPSADCRRLGSVRGARHGSLLFGDRNSLEATERMLAQALQRGATHVVGHEVIGSAHAARARGEAYNCRTLAAPPLPSWGPPAPAGSIPLPPAPAAPLPPPVPTSAGGAS